jgi:hypothetical protein
MKYLYFFTLIALTSCAMQTQPKLLINPVNGETVKCEVGSFDSVSECVEEYQSMGFWKR